MRSLGNNRPHNGFGREGRDTAKRLAKHKEIMDRLIGEGMTKLAASEKALQILTTK